MQILGHFAGPFFFEKGSSPSLTPLTWAWWGWRSTRKEVGSLFGRLSQCCKCLAALEGTPLSLFPQGRESTCPWRGWGDSQSQPLFLRIISQILSFLSPMAFAVASENFSYLTLPWQPGHQLSSWSYFGWARQSHSYFRFQRTPWMAPRG